LDNFEARTPLKYAILRAEECVMAPAQYLDPGFISNQSKYLSMKRTYAAAISPEE
jgi:hypothetical protein